MFPESLVSVALACPERKQRVMSMLADGFFESSDYSGCGAEREALRLMCHAIEAKTGVSVAHEVTRACDIDAAAQQIHCHLSTSLDGGTSCVFPDILEQIHPTAQQWLHHCHKHEEASVQAVAYVQMRDWQLENASWAVDQAV